MLGFLLDMFEEYTLKKRLKQAKSISEVAQILDIDKEVYYLEVSSISFKKQAFNLNFRDIYVYAALQNKLFNLEEIKISGLCEKMFNIKDIYIIFVSNHQFEYLTKIGALVGPRVHTIHQKIKHLHLVLNEYSKKLILNKPQYLNYPKELMDDNWFKIAILSKYYNKICDKIPEGHSISIVSHNHYEPSTPYKFKKNLEDNFAEYYQLLLTTITVWFPFDESNYDETMKWYEELLKEK